MSGSHPSRRIVNQWNGWKPCTRKGRRDLEFGTPRFKNGPTDTQCQPMSIVLKIQSNQWNIVQIDASSHMTLSNGQSESFSVPTSSKVGDWKILAQKTSESTSWRLPLLEISCWLFRNTLSASVLLNYCAAKKAEASSAFLATQWYGGDIPTEACAAD